MRREDIKSAILGGVQSLQVFYERIEGLVRALGGPRFEQAHVSEVYHAEDAEEEEVDSSDTWQVFLVKGVERCFFGHFLHQECLFFLI